MIPVDCDGVHTGLWQLVSCSWLWPVDLNQVILDILGLFLPYLVSILSPDSLVTDQKWCTFPSARRGSEASSAERLLLHFLEKESPVLLCVPCQASRWSFSMCSWDICNIWWHFQVLTMLESLCHNVAATPQGCWGAKIKLHWPNLTSYHSGPGKTSAMWFSEDLEVLLIKWLLCFYLP